MKNLSRVALLAMIASALPAIAHAELVSQMSAYVVSTVDGKEQLEPAYTVKPGQVIEYKLEHRNTFADQIGGVAIVGPVPEEAVFEGGVTSSTDAVFEIRADLDPDNPGEEWSELPAMREVILADGTRQIEEATPEHYTAVRWRILPTLDSQQVVTNTYRVRVR